MIRRRYWLALGPLVMVIGFVYSVFLFPYVRSFHIKCDDFPPILHSARQYHPNPVSWITRGFSTYFIEFPDLPRHHLDFCRPVFNATFWLESLLSPGTGPLNLTTNFLAIAITLILFMFFARRETSGNILFLSSMLVVFLFSPIWYQDVMVPAIRSNVLMALFALAAFLFLPSENSRHQGWRITLSVLCQLASLFSHETGVVTPVIAALLFVFGRDGKLIRRRLKVAPVFLLPLLCFAALRLVFYGGVSRAYVLEPEQGWVRRGVVNTLLLLTKPFFPWQLDAITSALRSPQAVLGMLMNLASYALVAYALLRPGKAGRKPLLRVLACLGVALAVVWVAPAALYMQLSTVFGVLATIVAATQISQDVRRLWVPRALAVGFVGLAVGQLSVFLTSFPAMVAAGEGENRLARVEFEGLRKAIATSTVPTLLLVNDLEGYSGSQAMLEMAAWPNRRRVTRLITVNDLRGGSSPQSSVRIARDGEAVRIEMVAGADQEFFFAQVNESRLGSDFVNQGLHYEMETVRWYSFTARLLRRFGKKVEPDNVTFGRRLVVTVPPEIAREGLLIVGFDPRDMSWFSKELL